MLVIDVEDPKDSFDTKNQPKHLNETEATYEVNKAILYARVRHYIERGGIMVSNINKICGIIWGTVYAGSKVSFEGK